MWERGNNICKVMLCKDPVILSLKGKYQNEFMMFYPGGEINFQLHPSKKAVDTDQPESPRLQTLNFGYHLHWMV